MPAAAGPHRWAALGSSSRRCERGFVGRECCLDKGIWRRSDSCRSAVGGFGAAIPDACWTD